ncbi:class I SAM-dependent methyltransferase [Agarilytica rhodophyticola]|uniref:class I SAM-dependent methyltransferase n=1 Tax=Agarilytica rhodophyticola TaxID=1737490 RepID=UPI000B346FB0|nr:methyltransferase [Agarilytica rhodophyticola]
MSDNLFKDLFTHYASFKQVHKTTQDLLVADENITNDVLEILKTYHANVLTNRKDIAQQCHQLDIAHYFSDFDFTSIEFPLDCIVYRISKERPVCHFVFNQLTKQLKDQGTLIIAGKKNEGIKGYYQKLVKDLKFSGHLKKQKEHYIATLQKTSLSSQARPLDDKNYQQLDQIEIDSPEFGHLSFYSKPGVYGWNKIDKGSHILWQTCMEDMQKNGVKPSSVVDLGCGYGYLSMQVLSTYKNTTYKNTSYQDTGYRDDTLTSLQQLHATDNNAAAIKCCKKNIQISHSTSEITVSVSADDCGQSIGKEFDLLLSNPPFHQGFDHSKSLTDKFLKNAAKLLNAQGVAYFVVNAFIGIEKNAEKYFNNVRTIKNTGQFKVIKLTL